MRAETPSLTKIAHTEVRDVTSAFTTEAPRSLSAYRLSFHCHRDISNVHKDHSSDMSTPAPAWVWITHTHSSELCEMIFLTPSLIPGVLLEGLTQHVFSKSAPLVALRLDYLLWFLRTDGEGSKAEKHFIKIDNLSKSRGSSLPNWRRIELRSLIFLLKLDHRGRAA